MGSTNEKKRPRGDTAPYGLILMAGINRRFILIVTIQALLPSAEWLICSDDFQIIPLM
jgi:hypothetical protein